MENFEIHRIFSPFSWLSQQFKVGYFSRIIYIYNNDLMNMLKKSEIWRQKKKA
jgi:hypothetical protein